MSNTTSEHFDALLIGVGQANKPLALTVAEKGWKTAVIERKFVGGSCINYGCTPTKTLIASAQVAHQARRASEYGILTGDVRVDYPAVKRRKNQIVEQFRNGIQQSFDEADNLTLIRGEARFSGPKQVEVTQPDGNTRTLTADHIFIDTGTSPRQPDLPGLETVPWLTSTTLMDLDECPQHLLILGGGYIALEFGQLFRRLGSEVTLIERGSQLLSHEDEEIASEIATFLTEEGIRIHLDSTVEQVSRNDAGGIELLLKTGQGAKTVSGSHLLVATGSTPNTAVLQLDAAAIKTDAEGYIQVNERLETTQPGVYALGDVKGGPAFTHISYDDFRIVRQNLLEGGSAAITDRPVPYTVFTDPQLGRIGLSEREARKQGRNVSIASMPMSRVARALETSQPNGLLKVVVDADSGQMLGAAMLGMEGGELMAMIQIAMMGNLSYQQLRDAVFAHPTLAEALNNLFAQLD
ncbi:mercuric reductase [Larkinella sp. VNQ87]|uniref:mercuric reductase n=1 Tax=Larkinella sp. VNQ87 TaxID=3400921 RepID=UPI003BFF3F49